jgi:hypothetical protein
MHKDNVMNEVSNPFKRFRTTFLNFEGKQKVILNIANICLESSKKR